jgi:hypothetical protein
MSRRRRASSRTEDFEIHEDARAYSVISSGTRAALSCAFMYRRIPAVTLLEGTSMSNSRLFFGFALASALLLAGCASGEEWRTWKEHPTHFASGDHLAFSIRNTDGREARVTRTQLVAAREEGWWGKPITVNQEQILER